MMTLLGRLTLLFSAAGLLLGDGGTLVLRKQAGPLTISIFSSPEPLRVGSADLSVMVQKSQDNSAVLDANVRMHLRQSRADGIAEVVAPARHNDASNKLLYAAHVNLPSAGKWQLAATVESPNGSAEVASTINVQSRRSPLVAYWPYFAVVPLLVLLFAINQLLKSRRNAKRPRVHA